MVDAKDKRTQQMTPRDEDTDLDQIVERLTWTPRERLQYLLDMLAFEEKARLAVISSEAPPSSSEPASRNGDCRPRGG